MSNFNESAPSGNQGIAEELYTDSANLGKFMALIMMAVGGVIGVLLILYGASYMMFNNDDKYLKVKGTVMNADCATITEPSYTGNGKGATTYKCNLTVGYRIDGKDYSTGIFVDGGSRYLVNEPIALEVDRNDYTNARQAGLSSGALGTMMFAIGLLVLGLAYFNYYVTYNYKVYAAGRGVGTIFSMFRSI